MGYRKHVCTNIADLLRNMKGRKIDFFEDDEGNQMTDQQVMIELAKAIELGHKLIGSKGCEGFDPFGGGCPGHPIEDGPTN
jgi:hypothetical protein